MGWSVDGNNRRQSKKYYINLPPLEQMTESKTKNIHACWWHLNHPSAQPETHKRQYNEKTEGTNQVSQIITTLLVSSSQAFDVQ